MDSKGGLLDSNRGTTPFSSQSSLPWSEPSSYQLYSSTMPPREFAPEVEKLSGTLAGIEKVLNLPKLQNDFKVLEEEASAPDLWDDPEKAQSVTSKLSRVQSTINRLTTIRRRVEDIPILFELAQDEGDESALADAGREFMITN